METTPFTGESGEVYTFEVYELSALGHFREVQGVYVFARKMASGAFQPVYVGETQVAKERLTNHHDKIDTIGGYGSTHICFFQTYTAEYRKLVEKDLIRAYRPSANLSAFQRALS